MAESLPELFQFPYSHFNEKARWAFDYKKVPHVRRAVLPGPHAPQMIRLSGQAQVPVIKYDDNVISGSADIISLLEAEHPKPPLYPADEAERLRALEIENLFDTLYGVELRRALFSVLLGEPDFVCNLFSGNHSALVRKGYRWMFPVTKRVMASSMKALDKQLVEKAYGETQAAFDYVVENKGANGYLVGDTFSVADLAAAALLAPAVAPENSPMEYPRPRPAAMEQWLERWSGHAGAEWVREMYRRHRDPTEVETPGLPEVRINYN